MLVTPKQFEDFTAQRFLHDDEQTPHLLSRAESLVVGRLGWTPWPRRSEEFILDGTGTSLLVLPTLVLHSVSELEVDGEALDPSYWRVSRTGMVELVRGQWPRGFSRIRVQAEHGVDNPPDLADVICSLASRIGVSPYAQTSVRAGQIQETFGAAGGFLLDELNILDRYKLPSGVFGV